MKIGIQKDLYIKDEEIKTLVTSIKEHEQHHWLFLVILAGSGCRPIEASKLRLKDFTSSEYDSFIIQNNKVSPARIEKKFLPPFAANYVKTYIRYYFQFGRFANGYLFPKLDGRSKTKRPHINPQSIDTWFARKRKEIGGSFLDITDWVKQGNHPNQHRPQYRISLYSLRRWFATKFYENCNNVVMTSRMLGHKDTEITMRYIDAANFYEKAKEIVNKADNFLNPNFVEPGQKRLSAY